MHCCRLWSLGAPHPAPLSSPPTAPLLPPPLLPRSSLPPLARTAQWFRLLGNCLRILPACSVIGRWHGGVPLPDPASCADYCLLVFQCTPISHSHPHTHTYSPPPCSRCQATHLGIPASWEFHWPEQDGPDLLLRCFWEV